MALMGVDDEIVTKWTLDADQFRDKLQEMAKGLRAQERQERDLALVKAHLAKQTDAATDAMRKMNDVMSSAGVPMAALAGGVAGLATSAIPKALGMVKDLVGGVVDLAERGRTWNMTIGENAERVNAVTAATKHLVSAEEGLTLVRRMSMGQVEVTNEQYAQAAIAITKLARITGTDIATATDKFLNGYLKGSSRELKMLGIEVHGANSAYEGQLQILSQLHKAGELRLTDLQKEKALQKEVQDAELSLGATLAKVGPIAQAFDWSHTKRLEGQITYLKWQEQSWSNFSKALEKGLGLFDRFILGSRLAQMQAANELRAAEQKSMGDIDASGAGLLGMGGGDNEVTGRGIFDLPGSLPKKSRSRRRGMGDKVANPWDRERNLGGWETRLGREEGQAWATLEARDFAGEAEYEARAQRLELLKEEIRLREENAVAQNKENEAGKVAAKQLSLEIENSRAMSDLKKIGVDALGQFASGLWGVAEAAIAGNENVVAALLNIPRAILMSIAQQQTGKALEFAFKAAEETAAGTAAQAITWGVPNPSSTMHFAAAGMYAGLAGKSAAIALGTGAAGLALGAGISAMSNSGAGAGGAAGRGGTYVNAATGAADVYRPTYGKKVDKDQPITVQVYIGDANDPGAVLFATKQVEARLAKAA